MEAILKLQDGKILLNGKGKYELGIEEQLLLNEMLKQFNNENFADLLQKSKEAGRVIGLKVEFLVEKL